MYENNGFAEGYAIGRDSGNCNGNGFGFGADAALWFMIPLFLYGFGGWGGFGGGFGGFGGGFAGAANGALTRGELCQDMNFQSLENDVRGVQQGLCDGFYAQAMATNGVQNSMNQGFAGINTALVTQGYENRIATNSIGTQLASCCCDIKEGIKDNTTQGVMNTNAIQQQISSCCCDIEKMNMQNRFDTAQYNCQTLQAIDKLGDRIIGYMDCNEKQKLRDENQALRLSASQAAQNAYLINALNPRPVPSFEVCNPYTGGYGGYNRATCNTGCGSCCA